MAKKTKQPKRRLSKLENTAYHEAGHAVMAYFSQRKFRYVTIDPDVESGSLGHIRYTRPGLTTEEAELGTLKDARIRRKVESDIMCSFAGMIAARMAGKRNCHVGGGGDYQSAIKVAMAMVGSEEQASTYMRWLWITARDVMRRTHEWKATKALAAALLKKRRIQYREAEEIIEVGAFGRAQWEGTLQLRAIGARLHEEAKQRRARTRRLAVTCCVCSKAQRVFSCGTESEKGVSEARMRAAIEQLGWLPVKKDGTACLGDEIRWSKRPLRLICPVCFEAKLQKQRRA